MIKTTLNLFVLANVSLAASDHLIFGDKNNPIVGPKVDGPVDTIIVSPEVKLQMMTNQIASLVDQFRNNSYELSSTSTPEQLLSWYCFLVTNFKSEFLRKEMNPILTESSDLDNLKKLIYETAYCAGKYNIYNKYIDAITVMRVRIDQGETDLDKIYRGFKR